jgi:hypothetical protein
MREYHVRICERLGVKFPGPTRAYSAERAVPTSCSVRPHFEVQRQSAARAPKPQWEFPRLCRGGSKSLTYPAVDTAAPSTKLRMVSRVIDGHERLSHTK